MAKKGKNGFKNYMLGKELFSLGQRGNFKYALSSEKYLKNKALFDTMNEIKR